MNLGDLVRVRVKDSPYSEKIGVILDSVEDTSGFYMFEVLIAGEPEWFDSIQLEMIDENR
tara:strand:- start:96 stop:275 length:180 start_codon:yes stop_codon:yes gene_type:complete